MFVKDFLNVLSCVPEHTIIKFVNCDTNKELETQEIISLKREAVLPFALDIPEFTISVRLKG